MRRITILTLAGALAGCGAEPASEPSPPQQGAAATPPKQAESASNGATGQARAEIPEALRGSWGLVPADCTSTRGDAKGRLDIFEAELRFYESRGVLGRIVERGDSRIVADFAFTGEGQSWQRRLVLDAQGDGRTLIRREQGAEAAPGAFRYQRCDAPVGAGRNE